MTPRAVRHHRAVGPAAARLGQRAGRVRPAGRVVRAGRAADRRGARCGSCILRALTGDRPRTATIAGVAVGVVGLAVLVLAGPASGGVQGTTWWGPWLVLLASLGWATGTFATTRLPVPPNPFALAARADDDGRGGPAGGRARRWASASTSPRHDVGVGRLGVPERGRDARARSARTPSRWRTCRCRRSPPTPTSTRSSPWRSAPSWWGSGSPRCSSVGAAVVLLAVVLVVAAPSGGLPKTSGGRGSIRGMTDRSRRSGRPPPAGPRWPRRGSPRPRPSGPVTRRHLGALLERLRLLQLDSVNVAVRAHYMPVFSRLGPYDRALVDDAAWAHSARRPRLLVEYWAHEASLLPVADWPLLLSGAKRRGWWKHYAALVEQEPALVEDVLAAVKELGPVGAGALEKALGAASDAAAVGRGLVGALAGQAGLRVDVRHGPAHHRHPRALPAALRPARAGAAAGGARRARADRRRRRRGGWSGRPRRRSAWPPSPTCATTTGWAPQASRQAVAELVEAGELEPIAVRGWRAPAYRVPGARMPRRITGAGAAVPVRPVDLGARPHRADLRLPLPHRDLRARAEARVRLLRVPVPARRRAGGPGRPQGRPGGRACCGCRARSPSPRSTAPRVAAELAAELAVMAEWLGLSGVLVAPRGDMAAPLAAAMS